MTTFWDVWLEPFDSQETTPTQRRNVIRSNLRDMIRSGMSGKQSLELFRSHNLGISTGDFYDIRREIEDQLSISDNISNLPDDYELSPFELREGNTDFGTQYQYIVGYNYEDKESGVRGYKTTRLLSDELGFVGDIREQAKEAILTGDSPLLFGELIDFDLLRVQVNPKY